MNTPAIERTVFRLPFHNECTLPPVRTNLDGIHHRIAYGVLGLARERFKDGTVELTNTFFSPHYYIVAENLGNYLNDEEVSEKDWNVVGYIILTIVPSGGSRIGYLTDCYIKEDRRREGFGRQLLADVISDARRIELRELLLSSNPQRKDADQIRKFYEQIGFCLISEAVSGGTNFYRFNLAHL